LVTSSAAQTVAEFWNTLPKVMSRKTKLLDADDVTNGKDLPAGSFSQWLLDTRAVQQDNKDVDVPCGTCNACCKSSYFIHIAPDESQTLRRIPKSLLFAAPGLPAGNVLMGYDENGSCPMLVDEKCSIYAHRPKTCRTYDCRVLAAAGVDGGGKEKARLNRRIRRWQFSYPTPDDRVDHAAVREAATFLHDHADRFPVGFVPGNPAQLAVLAVIVYDVFVNYSGPARDDLAIANAVISKKKDFDASRRR
jgi:Fe-S-cluster containining protein